MPRGIKKETGSNLLPAELKELEELRQFKASQEREKNQSLGIRPEYEDYKVPKGEENHAHLLIGFIKEANRLDRTKDAIGRSYKLILDSRAYTNYLDNMVARGEKVIKVLHIPEKGFLSPLDYYKMKKEAQEAKIKKAKAVAANQEAAIVMDNQ